jgi:hypothetical protein
MHKYKVWSLRQALQGKELMRLTPKKSMHFRSFGGWPGRDNGNASVLAEVRSQGRRDPIEVPLIGQMAYQPHEASMPLGPQPESQMLTLTVG